MRAAVLDHLDNFSESVCLDCGFVHRDCRCPSDRAPLTKPQSPAFLSTASSVTDSAIQTDPMMVVGTQKLVGGPGMPMFVPQNFYLSPDVRLPLSLGQPSPLNATTVNINPLISAPGVVTLPPAQPFAQFVNPNQSGVSVLRQPLLGVPILPSPAGIGFQIPGSGTAMEDASRKRKSDSSEMSDASVQTTGKSYVKKMKLRLGNITAADFKIAVGDSGKNPADGSSAAAKVGDSVAGESPAGNSAADVPAAKRDGETPVEKKFTAVWKLLEDSSDDEAGPGKLMPIGGDGKAPETVRISTSPVGISDSLASAVNGVSCSGVVPAAGDCERSNEGSEKAIGSFGEVGSSADETHAEGNSTADGKESPAEEIRDVMDDAEDRKLVIDVPPSEDACLPESRSESRGWEFRNGVAEGESPDGEAGKPEEGRDERSMDVSDVDGVGPSKSGDTSTTVPDDEVAAEKLPTKPPKVYGKFEYTPTGEHILRCLVPKCSQTFDRKLTADVHSHVHPGFVASSTDGFDGPTYLQCHRCEFQAPFYHW